VVPEELQAANDFQDQSSNVYIKFAFETPGKILIQLFNEDDSLFAEKHFTAIHEERRQEFKAQVYGTDEQEEADASKLGRVCARQDDNKMLKPRASRCGQFCSTRASCITPYCRRCYYTGGLCRFQKSCRVG
jgi:hypothetical protein